MLVENVNNGCFEFGLSFFDPLSLNGGDFLH